MHEVIDVSWDFYLILRRGGLATDGNLRHIDLAVKCCKFDIENFSG